MGLRHLVTGKPLMGLRNLSLLVTGKPLMGLGDLVTGWPAMDSSVFYQEKAGTIVSGALKNGEWCQMTLHRCHWLTGPV